MDTSLPSAILNNMVTATLILDDGLAIRYANPAAELLFSQSAKRIVEQSLSS
ncbi:PAS domain-containing protein [Vibrio parahaemolyticus]|nr:PAS domain-containing protein [Vibrio parahaemolyticus]